MSTSGRYAQELVDAGFAVEVADAPLLHDGLNVADLAHVLLLHERGVVPDPAARRLLSVCSTPSHARGAVRLRPGPRRGLQLPRARVRRADRPRRRLAARGPHASRGGADRAAAARATRHRRSGRGGRRVRPRRRAGRGRARRDVDGRAHLPAARAAVHVRALPARRGPPGAPRDRAPHRGARHDQPQPGGRGRGQRQPAHRRSGADGRPAGVRRGHRAHPRRDVADRLLHRRRPGRRPAGHEPSIGSPRTWRSTPARSSAGSAWPSATPARAC